MKYWDTGIQLIDGCTPVSEGCLNCWSARITHTYRKRLGVTEEVNGRIRFTGKIIINYHRVSDLVNTTKPTVFCIWNDLFHNDMPFESIDKIFHIMCKAYSNKYLILTKRPERMAAFLSEYSQSFDVNNPPIYLGTTTENQKWLDIRLKELLKCKPFPLFISYEPALEEIKLHNLYPHMDSYTASAANWYGTPDWYKCQINQVVAGAETGIFARPSNLDWFRSIRDQCEQAGVPFFLKQINAKRERLLDGEEHNSLIWMKNGSIL
jgi:protein gp37